MKKINSIPMPFRRFLWIILIFGLYLSNSSFFWQKAHWNKVANIQRKISAPVFPERKIYITDFGAVGDGVMNCRDAIQSAIDSCHHAGGGTVVVPQGIFLTGAIHLKSNVNLRIEEKAVLQFSRDVRQYLPVVFTRFEGTECMNYSPFVYAYNQENIAISGSGTLDGQADTTSWWPWAGKGRTGWKEGMPNQHPDRNLLMTMGEQGIPVQQRIFGEGHYLRPNFIQFYKSNKILIEGVTLRRSPMWVIHPVLCENVAVQKVTIISHGPNNDGCDPESCKNVLIRDCYFDTGDDCIAIKSGRNNDGRRVNTPAENILVQNCTMKDGHGGVVIGSEISGSCRNVYVENCVMDSPNLERALRIKTNSRRGGVVKNIHMRNVQVGEVSDAVVHIYFNYEEGDVDKYTPVVRNIYIDHVTSKKSKYALLLDGYERSPISNVRLEVCEFSGVVKGNLLNHVSDLRLKDVYINGKLMENE